MYNYTSDNLLNFLKGNSSINFKPLADTSMEVSSELIDVMYIKITFKVVARHNGSWEEDRGEYVTRQVKCGSCGGSGWDNSKRCNSCTNGAKWVEEWKPRMVTLSEDGDYVFTHTVELTQSGHGSNISADTVKLMEKKANSKKWQSHNKFVLSFDQINGEIPELLHHKKLKRFIQSKSEKLYDSTFGELKQIAIKNLESNKKYSRWELKSIKLKREPWIVEASEFKINYNNAKLGDSCLTFANYDSHFFLLGKEGLSESTDSKISTLSALLTIALLGVSSYYIWGKANRLLDLNLFLQEKFENSSFSFIYHFYDILIAILEVDLKSNNATGNFIVILLFWLIAFFPIALCFYFTMLTTVAKNSIQTEEQAREKLANILFDKLQKSVGQSSS